MAENRVPWDFLDAYRGKAFVGEWPTISEMFQITVERFPNRNCFTIFEPDRNTLTYAQVLDNVKKLAQWLLSQGIKKGDRVAVTGKNSPEWATVFLGTLFAGAVIVPIDNGLTVEEAKNLIEASGSKIVFSDEEKYESIKKTLKKVALYSITKKHADTYVYNLATEKKYTVEAALENDIAAILYTSGTTGKPKGVVLSHKNLVSDCYIAQTNLKISEEDVFYALLPIHHSYTMQAVFIESLSVGAEIVFGKSMAATKMLRELKMGKITMLLGVPLLFNKLLAGIMKGIRAKGIVVYGIMSFLMAVSYFITKVFKCKPGKVLFKSVLEKASLGDLRIAICGGGPLAPSVFSRYQALGVDFIQGYGLTETSPIIALNPKEHFKIESVGRFFHPHMEMKIDNPDENGIGEVLVKGPMVMQGYYNMPEETAEVFTEDGWFKTGDLGKLDSEHYLYLAGRAKNLIVTEGGKNVFPEEIENEFQLENDLEQITVQGYVLDASTKAEGIEALVYPADDLITTLGVVRNSAESEEVVQKYINDIIAKINKNLKPYARISKITILKEPLEMTTTRKVKRNYKK
ncbi:MAG TPA: AMP-binding protein [Treponemataceae bacterium]|nr:AMP-binding protein [Treponemataceae bacterium]